MSTSGSCFCIASFRTHPALDADGNFVCRRRVGEGPLRAPQAPLRTVRASFPAYGSSTSKAALRPTRLSLQLDILCDTNMADTSSGRARGRGAQPGGRTTSISYLPSPFKVISIRSRKEAPVGRGLTFVPGNLETRIRPITGRHSLLPTSQARTSISSPYGSPSLAGKDTGLPRSAPEVSAGLGTCCRPGSAVDHEVAPLNPPPASVPFGSSLSATLAWCP